VAALASFRRHAVVAHTGLHAVSISTPAMAALAILRPHTVHNGADVATLASFGHHEVVAHTGLHAVINTADMAAPNTFGSLTVLTHAWC